MEEVDFLALVREVAEWPGTVYMHCAQGHGRTGTLAAAVLVAEERGCQMCDEVTVNERGFGRWDGEVFETLEVFEAWLRSPIPVV